MRVTDSLPFVLMRGGTSKCVVLESRDLPEDPAERDALLLEVFGSPDPRQIDGIGGATQATSKALIVDPDDRDGADVAYTFAQVGVNRPSVDYGGNCGNCLSAVGPYAIDAGHVAGTEPTTTVRIYNTNTSRTIVAEVPVEGGRSVSRGEYVIDGVPGTGAPIKLWFENPAGAVTGELLPTGQLLDELQTSFGPVQATLLDAGTLVVFVHAEAVGATGTETAAEIDGNADLLQRLEAVRGAGAARLGLVDDVAEATTRSPALPKVAYVGSTIRLEPPPGAGGTSALAVRLMAGGRAHQTFAITGGIATAAAAQLRDSVVGQRFATGDGGSAVTIAHPAGTIVFDTDVVEGDAPEVRRVAAFRTARRLAEGRLLLR